MYKTEFVNNHLLSIIIVLFLNQLDVDILVWFKCINGKKREENLLHNRTKKGQSLDPKFSTHRISSKVLYTLENCDKQERFTENPKEKPC